MRHVYNKYEHRKVIDEGVLHRTYAVELPVAIQHPKPIITICLSAQIAQQMMPKTIQHNLPTSKLDARQEPRQLRIDNIEQDATPASAHSLTHIALNWPCCERSLGSILAT